MTYLLDTDSLSLAYIGHDIRVRMARVAPPDRIAVPVITRFEVLKGRIEAILKAADGPGALRMAERLRASEDYMAKFQVLPFDSNAGTEFDRMLANKALRKVGRADLLIASITLAHKATLVTRNLKDFTLVPGLAVENWAD
ncbi:type II toxin-antitoxin system VapC family toxin [Urbifossiella limnaea]|uniref:Ribonuclease VapC1 n=1 Tax=Urbifossiella limnaea TaxID=2528023 RepID=A0A517XKY9_9BACT|nr:type II toxin-antitoxin system VapC family toxin [Urbifossiella limnaea]QDU18126.1 Ribonuclease VapC1 [Urbifossiella limnaea]